MEGVIILDFIEWIIVLIFLIGSFLLIPIFNVKIMKWLIYQIGKDCNKRDDHR